MEEEVKGAKKEDVEATDSNDVVSESDINDINISEEVVATIAGIAAQEVKGVSSMNASGIGEMLGVKTKGVKVQVGEKDTIVDINLTVEYGSRIPDIAWEVQNKVKTQVESMTGLNVAAVNVHVQGVNMPKKKNEVQQENIEETKVEVIDEPADSSAKE